MERTTDRSAWQEFSHSEFPFRFRYPAVTPEGRTVERTEDRRGDAVRVHLTTADKAEVYVEVSRFPGLAPPEEYARHKPYLEERFGSGSTTALGETNLAGRPAWVYGFRWEGGERSAHLLGLGGDTYRIIHDPRFPLNAQIMDTLTVVD